jgi:hypothetical protein
MKQRFYLFRRCGTYYLQDARTKKQQSLDTKDRSTAMRLLEIGRQTDTHDGFNQLILKTCLTVSDSMLTKRTWADVMAEMKTHGRESTRIRCERATNCSAFKSLQHIKLVDNRKVGPAARTAPTPGGRAQAKQKRLIQVRPFAAKLV